MRTRSLCEPVAKRIRVVAGGRTAGCQTVRCGEARSPPSCTRAPGPTASASRSRSGACAHGSGWGPRSSDTPPEQVRRKGSSARAPTRGRGGGTQNGHDEKDENPHSTPKVRTALSSSHRWTGSRRVSHRVVDVLESLRERHEVVFPRAGEGDGVVKVAVVATFV